MLTPRVGAALPLVALIFVALSSGQVPQSSDAMIGALGNHGVALLNSARVSGQYVRQCSCGELHECILHMKMQVVACADRCFPIFGRVTATPSQLKRCFEDRISVVDSFLGCLEHRAGSCVNNLRGPLIPRTDINMLLMNGERIIAQRSQAMQTFLAPIERIVNATGEFALCTKACFLASNQDSQGGYCFDRHGCQPYLSDIKTKATLSSCTRRIHWKEHASEICDCSVNAGLTDLRQYCGMIHLMDRKRPQSRRQH